MPFVVPAGAARKGAGTVLFGCCPNDVKVLADDTDGRLAVFEYHGRVRGGPPLHLHKDQDEIYFIREGRWIFVVGGETHHLGPGDTIFLPRGLPHSFAQTSEEGRLVFMFTPAGTMAGFFEAIARFNGPPEPAVEKAVFARHGMEVVGPPILLD
jgi:quercetin 2,3-dioxygenase